MTKATAKEGAVREESAATSKPRVSAQMWILEESSAAPFADGVAYPPQAFKGHNATGEKQRELHLPQWMESAEEWTRITPDRFREVRWLVHQMTVEQCAAFLRVSESMVRDWEAGRRLIPYAAYMALRLLVDVRHLPHQVKEWDGWQIINAGPDVGMLYDGEKTGAMFSPSELRAMRWVAGERDAWQRRAEKAEAKAAELEAENTRLRKLFLEQGVTRELRQMHARIGALLEGVGTAELIEFASPVTGIQAREKAA